MSKPALAKPTGRKYQKLEDSERSRAPGAGRKTNATKVAINIQKVADQAVVVQQQKNLTNFLTQNKNPVANLSSTSSSSTTLQQSYDKTVR